MNTMEQSVVGSKGNISITIHTSDTESDKLAILCAGYLDSKDYKHLVSLSKELQKSGYTVARFDPTGTWKSEGTMDDYTTSQYLDDIGVVLEYMLSRGKYINILLGGAQWRRYGIAHIR